MGADLFVLGSSRKWAELTLVAPASPAITAAFWLCDEVAATGGHLTHCLQNLCEAQALSVVWSRTQDQSQGWGGDRFGSQWTIMLSLPRQNLQNSKDSSWLRSCGLAIVCWQHPPPWCLYYELSIKPDKSYSAEYWTNYYSFRFNESNRQMVRSCIPREPKRKKHRMKFFSC